MTKEEKHRLYECIMRDVSDVVKKHLDEIYPEDESEHLNEMSIHLKEFRNRVESNTRFQLVENWCQLFDKGNDNFRHWRVELAANINSWKFLKVKDGDKRKTLVKMLIHDFDYDDINMIMNIIADKFKREHINDKQMRVDVSDAFTENIRQLIDVISVDALSTDDYINDEFGQLN